MRRGARLVAGVAAALVALAVAAGDTDGASCPRPPAPPDGFLGPPGALVDAAKGSPASVAAALRGAELRVTMNHFGRDAGFFVYVVFALNALEFAEEAGAACASVWFGEKGLSRRGGDGGRPALWTTPNLFYDASYGPNVWEYFFAPVRCPEGKVGRFGQEHRVVGLTDGSLAWLHEQRPRSVFTYQHGLHASRRERFDEGWYAQQRVHGAELVRKYARVRPHVRCAVDAFWRAQGLDGAPVMGVHLRGTDKRSALGGRVVGPDEYYPRIDAFLEEHGERARIFVATDSKDFLKEVKGRYGGRVAYRDALRSSKNAFKAARYEKEGYRKGEDALIDTLLLARCDALLKPSSSVSEFALYFNPALQNATVEMQYAGSYER